MRKKRGFTIIEQAIAAVPAFADVKKRLEHQVELRGQSTSTLQNYIRRIALFVIHFGRMPDQISEDEINEYLVSLARDPRSPSRSSFKHMVYGLLLPVVGDEQKSHCPPIVETRHKASGYFKPTRIEGAIYCSCFT